MLLYNTDLTSYSWVDIKFVNLEEKKMFEQVHSLSNQEHVFPFIHTFKYFFKLLELNYNILFSSFAPNFYLSQSYSSLKNS